MFNFENLENLRKKKIVIVGRGSTARFAEKLDKSFFVIGLNINKIFSRKVDLFIDSKKEKIMRSKYRQIKVGSVYFYLYNLLQEINNVLNKKKNVYLLGFDFRKFSHDDDILKKQLSVDMMQQIVDVNSQSIIFNLIKRQFEKININLCGFTIHSDTCPYSLRKYNNHINKDLKIVAELTTNHQGSTKKLNQLILGSISSGVKNIKLQMRDVESFYPKQILKKKFLTPISKTFYEYRKNLELTNEQIDLLKYYKKKFSLNIIFSALDYVSYIKLKKEGFNFFKIPSTISTHKKYIYFISQEKIKKIIISTGMTKQSYVNYVLKSFKKFKELYLLHCVSAYPTPFQAMNLNTIGTYAELSKKNKNLIPGYSSHDIGSTGSIMAIALGAKMIEKHVKIGVTDWLHFDDTAIDVHNELPLFVDELNAAFNSLGSKKKKILSIEDHKYDFKKK